MKRHRKSLRIVIAYNEPNRDDPDWLDVISEAGVLDEAEDVYKALSHLGYSPEYLPLTTLDNCIAVSKMERPDAIFNLCEGLQGQASYEMYVAGLWELMGIPYTGNPPLTLGLAQDKVLSKKLFESRKIHTPAYQVFIDVPKESHLTFPVIAKPSREDASLGITQDSVAVTFEKLRSIVESLLEKYQQPILVEEFINGREFNISIIGQDAPKVLAISEIDFSGLDENHVPITSYEAKWMKDHPIYKKTPPICPARLNEDLKIRLEDAAIRVYKVLGGRDYGRVDVRMDLEDRIFILEFNPNPDISLDAGFSRAVKAAGMQYADFIQYVVGQAMNRNHHA